MRKNRARSWLLVGVLACSLAVTLSLGTAPSAHASVFTLGGLNLKAYCQSLGYPSVRTIGTTYYDWRCVDRNGNNVSFAMWQACHWQYNDRNAWDVTPNFYVPTGGICIESALVLGGIDVDAYCRYLGYSGARLDGSTAYDWHCLNIYTGWVTGQLDMDDACDELYHEPAVARFANFYYPTSWQCWW